MILDGFRISGYRSFGALEQEIRDLGKVNVFIGKNNLICLKVVNLKFPQFRLIAKSQQSLQTGN